MQLYGGAITLEMPEDMVDVSGFRQVPDHQEVFVGRENDQSMVVEILEQQPGMTSCQDALRFHYREVTDIGQEALMSLSVRELASPSHACLISGCQPMAKFNQAATDVWVLMALIQVAQHETDILVTWNIPTGYCSQMQDQFIQYLGTFRINDYALFK